MRIAYHNPWANASENQAYMSMAEAARRIGVDLVACTDETEIEACRPDFVLTVASSVPKITDFPTYLTVHEPKALFLEQPVRTRNLLSFDGYLTISDSLARFIKDFCAGTGRIEEPGFCYLTPQTTNLRCDWQHPARADRLRVVYFGTNWNRRMPVLFRALDQTGILRIRGPEASWALDGYVSYDGPADFDGVGPQRAYAEAGIGLALMDERWLREDVISNRIFEISSVGAVSLCPDMPWTRKWFGDSVFYFDAARPMREVAEQVKAHYAFCKTNPDTAAAMGEAARQVFEAHFSAEKLVANAVAYHQRKTAQRAAQLAAMDAAPRITVVVRCGGRKPEVLQRAVDSIRRQSFGTFTVILAKYRDIELSAVTSDRSGAISAFDEFLIEGGGRAEMLWAGLRRIETPYFAVLDDDDFWLSDHFESLFSAGRRVSADFDMAFSGQVEFDFPGGNHYGVTPFMRNIGRFGFPSRVADAWQIAGAIGTNCFVARTDLLSAEILQTPIMRSAEDSVLINLMARRTKPVFSWRATAFYRPDSPDGSNWREDEQRTDDEISFALRTSMMYSPRWLVDGVLDVIDYVWVASKRKPGSAVMGEQLDRLTAGSAGQTSPRGIRARPGVQGFVSEGPQAKLRPGRYIAVFLITPNEETAALPPHKGAGPVGTAEIVVAALGGPILGRRDFTSCDVEVAMTFSFDATMVQGPVELRVFSHGNSAFTVGSVGLHEDRGDGPPHAVDGPDRTLASGKRAAPRAKRTTAPQIETRESLRAELDAMRRSTSWRLTAPLRWIMRAARRGVDG